MKPIKLPILLATSFLFIYTLGPFIGFPDYLILAMLVLSPVMVIWMVFRVLKDGIPSEKTFDEYFYEDSDITRTE